MCGLVLVAVVVATAALVNAQADGWTIPAGAAEEKSPVQASERTLADGKKLFTSNCQRCHGPGGTGDGPDADKQDPPEDLTDGARASINPDGVMFYKVWNGRRRPNMPAFKTDMTRQQVWTVVAYAKSLRKGA
jgi:mono/diheme cytochrome c family protein